MKQYLEGPALAFYSLRFYREVGRSWKGFGHRYLLALLAFTALLLSLRLLAWGFELRADPTFRQFTRLIPPITIEHGRARARAKQPYQVDYAGYSWILCTTTVRCPGIEKGRVLNRESRYLKGGFGSQVLGYPSRRIEINGERLWSSYRWLSLKLAALVWVTMTAMSFLGWTLLSLLLAGWGAVVTHLAGISIGLVALMRLAVMAMTPALVLTATLTLLLPLLAWTPPWWALCALISFAYMTLAALASREVPAESKSPTGAGAAGIAFAVREQRAHRPVAAVRKGALPSVVAILVCATALQAEGLRITNPDEQPIAGAQIEVFVEGGPTPAFSVAGLPVAAAVTDAGGLARIGIPALENVAVIVDQPNYSPRLLEGLSAYSEQEIQLERGVPLEGSIELPGDKPVVPDNGLVCAHGSFALRMGGRSREWRRCTPIASDGSFALSGLPDGPVRAEVLVPGFLPLVKTIELRKGLRLPLEEGMSVTGRVADSQGRLLVNAQIETAGAIPATTEKNGRFVLSVPRLPAEIHVGVPGFRKQVLTMTENAYLDLRLDRAEQVSGTLLGEPGQEISEVTVSFWSTDTEQKRYEKRILGTKDGRFRLELPRPGTYSLRLEVRGYRSLVQSPVEVGSGQVYELGVMALSRGAGIRGVLWDTVRGQPVAGVILEAFGLDNFGLATLMTGQGAAGAVSDADGAFTLAGLDVGRYHVRWRRHGFAPVHRLLDLEVNGLLELGTMYLGDGVALHGRLRGPDGQAKSGLQVRLYDAANEVLVPLEEATSGAEGDYRLSPIAAGRYRVVIEGDRLLLAQEIELAPQPAAQRLDFEVGGGNVRGRLTYHGLPVAGGRITVTPAMERRGKGGAIRLRSGEDWLSFGRQPTSAFADVGADGSFSLLDVPPGLAWLVYLGTGERPFMRSVLIPEHPEAELRIELRGQRLEGRVVEAETGTSIRSHVSAISATEVALQTTESLPEDGFSFDDLDVGRYDLLVRAEGYVPARRTDVDVSDESAVQVIELTPSEGSGLLEVALSRTDGSKVSGLPLILFDTSGQRSLPFQENGAGSAAELPAGEYCVAWTDPLHGVGVSATVRVAPRRRPVVDRVLTPGASVALVCPAHLCADAPVELLTVHSPNGADLTSLLSGITPALRFSKAGDLSLGRLSPGRYVFRLWLDGEQWEREAAVGSGEVRIHLR